MKPVEQVLNNAKFEKEDINAKLEEDINEIVLVGSYTHIPELQQLLKEYLGKKPSGGINLDKAFAYGAAVQRGVLSTGGDESLGDVVLVDVNPLTFSIKTTGCFMTKTTPHDIVIPFQEPDVCRGLFSSMWLTADL